MALTLTQSRGQIAALVKHFAANRANYLAPHFNEAQARQEFIDPLFICLGWDIRNENRVAPQYREVIVEAIPRPQRRSSSAKSPPPTPRLTASSTTSTASPRKRLRLSRGRRRKGLSGRRKRGLAPFVPSALRAFQAKGA